MNATPCTIPPPGFLRERHAKIDLAAWTEVVVENCYELPDSMEGAVCLDIGAHIGCFAFAALARDARRVVSYEADPRNWKQLWENFGRLGDPRLEINQGAVWRSDCADLVPMSCFPDQPGVNTGAGSVAAEMPGGCVVHVAGMPFASVLEDMDRVDLCKLDCEGSEFPILYTCPRKALRKVLIYVAELHSDLPFRESARVEGHANTVLSLMDYMKAAGYKVRLRHQKLVNRPIMFAVREGEV